MSRSLAWAAGLALTLAAPALAQDGLWEPPPYAEPADSAPAGSSSRPRRSSRDASADAAPDVPFAQTPAEADRGSAPLAAPDGGGGEAPPLAEPTREGTPAGPQDPSTTFDDKGRPFTPPNLAETADRELGVDEEGNPMEREGPPIAAIEVYGNRLISRDVILLSMEAKPGDRITEKLVEQDIQNLRELGYFAYVEPEVVPTETGEVVLVFKVIENPVVREVRVEGATLVSLEQLREAIVVEPGNVLNSTQLRESISRVTALYQESDYFFCGILTENQIDMDRQSGVLTLKVAEPVLGEIRFKGNNKTKDFVLLREFEVRRGRVLQAEKLRRSLRNLYRLQFFADLKGPKPVLSDDLSVVDLEIDVEEQRTGQASAGGGFSSLNGLIGFVDVAERNFKGRGQTMRVKWEFGGQRSYQLDFVEPWFKGRPRSLGMSIFSTRVNRAQFRRSTTTALFEERRTGFAVSTSRRIGKDTRLSMSFSNEDVSATAQPGNPLPTDLAIRDTDGDGEVRFGQQFVTVGWVKDARDNPLGANEGYRYSAAVTTTGGPLRGPAHFNRYVTDVRRYFPFGKNIRKKGSAVGPKTNWTFATRTRYGFHSVFSGQLTFSDRFAIGGTDSVRGYEDREFTGSRFFLTNFELRRHLSKAISLVMFYDTGDAWGLDGQDFDLNSGYGFGIRFVTPLGPFRLDFGKGEDRGGRFHFGIGQAF